jgi:predicted PurR-regulated permease PerM
MLAEAAPMRPVRIDGQTLLLGVALAFGGWILLRLTELVLPILIVFLVGLVTAVTLAPVVRLLRRVPLPPGGWRLPRAAAVLLTYLAGGALLIGVGYWVGRSLVVEVTQFSDLLANLVTSPAASADAFLASLGLSPALTASLANLANSIRTAPQNALQVASVAVTRLTTFVVQSFIVLALAFFLIVDSEGVLNFVAGLFPPATRNQAHDIMVTMGQRMGGWLLGRLGASTIVGVLCGLTMAFLGLPFPILVGVVSGLFDIIPLVGPTVLIPVVFALGLSHSLLVAGVAAAAFFLIGQLDADLLTPVIMGQAVRLSPLMVVIAIPLGAALYGVLGALLAVPVAAALHVFVDQAFLPWLHSYQTHREHQG